MLYRTDAAEEKEEDTVDTQALFSHKRAHTHAHTPPSCYFRETTTAQRSAGKEERYPSGAASPRLSLTGSIGGGVLGLHELPSAGAKPRLFCTCPPMKLLVPTATPLRFYTPRMHVLFIYIFHIFNAHLLIY